MITQFQELLAQPFFPWLILLIIAIGWVLSQVSAPASPTRLSRLLDKITPVHILGAAGGAFWLILFLILFLGLCTLIYDLVWQTDLKTCLSDQSSCRFLLTKTAALTAVLGAMVALPFTIYRLKLTNEQNKLTTEQNRHNENVLFNEKLHEANSDLHAMRQVTVPRLDKDGKETHKLETKWEDDIIRRNGAIERLRALAEEAADTGQLKNGDTISRLLQTYFQEIPFATSSKQSNSTNEEKIPAEKEKPPTDIRPDVKSAGLALERIQSLDFNAKIARNALNRSSNEIEDALKRLNLSHYGNEFNQLSEQLKHIGNPLAGAELTQLREQIKRATNPLAGAEQTQRQEALKRASEPYTEMEEPIKRLGQQSSGSKKGYDDTK